MKALHLLALTVFSFSLMGCQVEINALDANLGTDVTTETETDDEPDTTPSTPPVLSDPKTVTLYWSAPLERVNGDTMAGSEVGGYEIRYKKPDDASFTNIMITDSATDQYSIVDLEDADDYSFEVAVYDSAGVYSDFVTAVYN